MNKFEYFTYEVKFKYGKKWVDIFYKELFLISIVVVNSEESAVRLTVKNYLKKYED